MKKAHNPYGDGKASQKILDASLKMQNMGKLSIEAPEDIMLNFNRNLLKVNDQITVLEFEKVENALVKIVYDNENPRFPYPHMDLKNKYVIVEKFNK